MKTKLQNFVEKNNHISEESRTKYMEAACRVSSMDRSDGYEPRDIPTIVSALLVGLDKPDTDAAWDALFMLTTKND